MLQCRAVHWPGWAGAEPGQHHVLRPNVLPQAQGRNLQLISSPKERQKGPSLANQVHVDFQTHMYSSFDKIHYVKIVLNQLNGKFKVKSVTSKVQILKKGHIFILMIQKER